MAKIPRKPVHFNPFVPNAPFLYPLKILENLKFSDVFRGVEKGCIGNKWVNGPEVLSSASDKAKMSVKNFSKDSDLTGSGIFLPTFPFRANLKLCNINKTPKLVKKVITNLDLSKASDPNFILVVVLKKCKSELLYYLNSSTIALRNRVFQTVRRSHLWSQYLRMLGRGLSLKTTFYWSSFCVK